MRHLIMLPSLAGIAQFVTFALCPPLGASQLITFDVPGAVATNPTAINSLGQVTGFFCCEAGYEYERGFVRDADGTITTFYVQTGQSTIPHDINDSGTIAGTYIYMDQGQPHGFVITRPNVVQQLFFGTKHSDLCS